MCPSARVALIRVDNGIFEGSGERNLGWSINFFVGQGMLYGDSTFCQA